MTQRPVAIVTGAGSGVGRAAAVQLAKAGYDVTLAARTRSALEETADLVAMAGGRSLVVPTDLGDAGATRALVAKTLGKFGRLDAIANIAGHAPLCPVEQLTAAVIQQCIDTNVTGVINLVAEAWPTLKAQRSGVIVNVSSMASIDPFPGFSAYASAKIAVNMFTQCIGKEGKAVGVQAVAVAPGAIETPMLRSLFGKDKLPTEKTLSPESVAEVIVGCITGTRVFRSGETILLPSP